MNVTMKMSDMQMIVAVLKMQSDLRSAMDEIQVLVNELQKKTEDLPSPIASNESDVKYVEVTEPPKIVNVKKQKATKPKSQLSSKLQSIPMDVPIDVAVPTKKKTSKGKKPIENKNPNRAILAWNAYKSYIKDTMESETNAKVSNTDVMNKAVSTKNSDPEAYKDFTYTWLAENS